MYQYFKQNEDPIHQNGAMDVDNHFKTTMDGRDHVKNAASSKSLMSRGNFIKKAATAMLIAALSMGGCGKPNGNEIPEPDPNGNGNGGGENPIVDTRTDMQVYNAVYDYVDKVCKKTHKHPTFEEALTCVSAAIEREVGKEIKTGKRLSKFHGSMHNVGTYEYIDEINIGGEVSSDPNCKSTNTSKELITVTSSNKRFNHTIECK